MTSEPSGADMHADLQEIDRKLSALIHSVQHLQSTQEKLMAAVDDLKALVQRLNDATTKISDRIDRLIATIKPAMTQAEVDEVKAALTTEADRLDAMGKDPANPVPPVP